MSGVGGGGVAAPAAHSNAQRQRVVIICNSQTRASAAACVSWRAALCSQQPLLLSVRTAFTGNAVNAGSAAVFGGAVAALNYNSTMRGE